MNHSRLHSNYGQQSAILQHHSLTFSEVKGVELIGPAIVTTAPPDPLCPSLERMGWLSIPSKKEKLGIPLLVAASHNPTASLSHWPTWRVASQLQPLVGQCVQSIKGTMKRNHETMWHPPLHIHTYCVHMWWKHPHIAMEGSLHCMEHSSMSLALGYTPAPSKHPSYCCSWPFSRPTREALP